MTIRELWEDTKAWWRNERRVAPYGTKGRIYQRKDALGALLATGKFKGTIRPTGYYNAKENQWYDIDEHGNRTPRKEK